MTFSIEIKANNQLQEAQELVIEAHENELKSSKTYSNEQAFNGFDALLKR